MSNSQYKSLRRERQPMTYAISEVYNLPELMGIENAVQKMERAMKRDRDLAFKRASRQN